MNNETIREKIKNNDFADIENWDTSGVTSMCQLFYKKTTFNEDISKWNVSNVKDMSYMFTFNESFNRTRLYNMHCG
jgi:MoxR-like ATPase